VGELEVSISDDLRMNTNTGMLGAVLGTLSSLARS